MRTITIREILRLGYPLFDFEYNYQDKDNFEDRFADEYMFENIGFETVEMFLFKLRVETQKLAPHYDRLYTLLKDINIELERGSKISESFDNSGTDNTTGSDVTTHDGDSYNQEYPKISDAKIRYDEINSAVKNIYESMNSRDSNKTTKDSGVKEIINHDIPIHEAIANLHMIRTDITDSFIKALRPLFSYIIW